jgi:glycosyltransferase involved in cell wall biosynthesis
MNKLRIACIAPYVAYAGIDHAGGLYLERYIRDLRSLGHEVRLYSPRTTENVLALSREIATPSWLGAAPPQGRLRRASQFLLHGVGSDAVRPQTFLQALEPEAREWLELADIVDLQWYDCLTYAPLFRRHFPDKVLVGTAHDLLSQSVARAATLGPTRLTRTKNRLKRPLVRFWEARALQSLDHVYVFKQSDINFMRSMRVRTSSSVTLPVIEMFEEMDHRTTRSPPIVVFVAAFARPENDEAARWLIDHVVPTVRSHIPEAQFRFAGSRPAAWLRDLESANIEVTGYLDSMDLAYRGAACVVVPLQRGAGLKFKTIQAMALGIPVVSTSIGAEGIKHLCGIDPYAVADSPAQFSAAVGRALAEDEARSALLAEQAGQIRVKLNFHQQVESQAARLEALVASNQAINR